MKSKRHEKILEIINQYEVDTQEDLARMLGDAGFSVTQATISRDIRELKLSKVNGHDGRQKYVAMKPVSDTGMNDKLSRVLKEGYISSAEATKLIVVRTMPGMAMGVATALDAMDLPGFVGCVSGDDTIFCALREDADAGALIARINKVVNG